MPGLFDARPAAVWDLNSLLAALDPRAPRAERNLWLVRLLEWLRRSPVSPKPAEGSAPAAVPPGTPRPVLKLRHLLNLLDREPEYRARLVELLARTLVDMDATLLLADFGFASHRAFFSEVLERLQRKLLPGTPDTEDWSELFQLMFSDANDAQWLQAIDDETLDRLAALLREAVAASRHPKAAESWRTALLDATVMCLTQARALAFSADVRIRLAGAARALVPFHQLLRAFQSVRQELEAAPPRPEALGPALRYFHTVLDACRRDADTVYDTLEDTGISVNIVFAVQQLQARLDRAQQLLDCLLSEAPARAVRDLVVQLAHTAERRRSVRALVARNYSLLARKMAERNAETGEHYITRNRREYLQMVWRAAGGGAVTTVTVFLKFLIGLMGLSGFFAGMAAGLNYAISFVAIQLAHFTLATKQPAMTAPAMAHKLGDLGRDEAVEDFVDEVSHLIRTQVAGIVGNVSVVLPCALAVQWGWSLVFGAPLIGVDQARYAVDSLSALGWTPVYAAATGVLLFASSLIAGWAENWFVLHRLGSALRWNPRIVARLGAHRAARWSAWLQAHVSGLAGNVSLGLMLGLVPAVAHFFGIGFDVRHVTLASGQLGVALGAIGWELLSTPGFWLAVTGIALTGVLNVTVSFLLAFRLALRARNIRLKDRGRIHAAVWARLRQHPWSFLWPPRDPAAS
ncbi:MAG: site-specific recombinase [Caldimonas manganoxidans]|nr:site-specific recombinase [Caldimonas manganoxidans]